MTDPDITVWCDFVRGILDPETEARMQELFVSRSRSPAAALRRVAAVGRWDAEHPVPDAAVRVAKAAGSLQRRGSTEAARPLAASILKRLPFKVVADSLHQAAGAGARDVQSYYRHIVFEAEGYSVDVRLEHEREPAGTVVLGQLMRHGGEVGPVNEVPILLVARDKIVGRGLTGEFGEFHAEGLPIEPMDLCLLVGSEQCLELPLEPEAAPIAD
jgi:hypothetical protein